MTQLTAPGRLSDAEVADATILGERLPEEAPLRPAALLSVSLDPDPPDSLLANEAVIRRALAVADVTTIAVAVLLVLSQLGADVGVLVALASMPMVILVFKIAGLYNRD